MKIGYPCINWTIECKEDKTFRFKSYSEKRLVETVENNLNCLLKVFIKTYNMRISMHPDKFIVVNSKERIKRMDYWWSTTVLNKAASKVITSIFPNSK